MKKQLPGWAVLLIITLVAGLALGGTYALTKEPIDQQALLQAENARRSALPQADSFQELALGENAPVDWANAGLGTVKGKTVPLALEDIDAIAGATFTSTAVVNAINAAYEQYKAAPASGSFTGEAQGFAGPVAVEAAFDGDTIASLKIGDDRFQETPGLGAKALEESFQSQFLGGEKAVGYVAQITVKGYKGPVEVTVGLDDTLTLTGISVGGSDFAETAGLGAKAKEPAFQNQFAGKKTPVSLIKTGGTPGDNTVDAITAATITSTAVVNGVNTVVKYVKSDILGIAGIEMPARPDSCVFSAEAQGFRGPVYVEAAFDEEGKVSYLSVGNDRFAEDIGAGVKDPEFMHQFIGKAVPASVSDIDAISGATVSSTAVVTALNEAFSAAQGVVVEKPVKEAVTLPEKPAEGVFSAAEQGFAGPVYVEAAFDADDTLSYINIGDEAFAETEGIGAKALEDESKAAFLGKKMPLAPEDVDILTGATFTKTAIVNGLNKAFDASKGGAEAPAPEPEQPEETQPIENGVSAEALCGQRFVRVTFAQESGVLSALNVEEKASAAGQYAPSAEQKALREKFLGKALPLSVQESDPFAFAAAVAVNKAYAATLPAPEPTAAPIPEPTAEPAEEPTQAPAPAVTEAPAKAPAAVSDLDYSGSAVTFFTAVKADVSFDHGVISDLALSEKAVGGAEYAPMAQAEALRAQLIGKTAPVDAAQITGVPAYTASAVALAVNEAYEQYAAGGAAAPEKKAPAAGRKVYTGEAVIFFTALRAEAAFDGDVLADLQLMEKPVGNGEYAPMAQGETLRAQLIGQKAPVSAAQMTGVPAYTASAVALAVNEAYEKSLKDASPAPAAGNGEEDIKKYVGRCIMFFDRYTVSAVFDGDALVDFEIYETPVGDDEPIVWEADPLYTALPGQKMPLDEKAFRDSYVEQAVVIALNEAYALSLAGQQ